MGQEDISEPRVAFEHRTEAWGPEMRSPAAAGTSAGTGRADRAPAGEGAEAVAAGCSKAAGPAGSNHSHPAVRTEVASVKSQDGQMRDSLNMQFNKIKYRFNSAT